MHQTPSGVAKTGGGLKKAEIVFTIVCTIAPVLPSVPVVWKVILGFAALCGIVHLVSTEVEYFRRIPRDVLWGRFVIVTVFLFIGSWTTIVSAWRSEMAARTEGDIFEGKYEPGTNCMALPVQIGSTGGILIMTPPKSGEKMPPYFAPFKDANFLVECGQHGPLISTTVRDRDGNLVVSIDRNHWTVYPPYCLDKNYTKYGFEVLDNSKHVLLQIRFMDRDRKEPMRLQVQGEWWNDEGRGMRIVLAGSPGGASIPLFRQNQHNDALIKPIFKYPSRDFWGEFDN